MLADHNRSALNAPAQMITPHASAPRNRAAIVLVQASECKSHRLLFQLDHDTLGTKAEV
jgi:hypothetical protein